ncbi:MAG TPA: hypothetical protein VHI52_17200 [Verrucomicrobiae bacterium]|nr:hypothetical protein [Verrucomicrobiae bacterium]
MTGRHLTIAMAFALFLGTGSAVMVQRQQIRAFRAEQASDAIQTPAVATTTPAEDHEARSSESDKLTELLRLRSTVTQLSARKRELAGVEEEAEKLKTQLAMAQTNANRLPLGYIRRTEAQMVGFSSPEGTLQTFLYAIQHQDATLALQAVNPAQAQRLRARLDSADPEHNFFKEAGQVPGLEIQSRRTLPDGSVELQVSPVPGEPPQALHFELISGEWKLGEPF